MGTSYAALTEGGRLSLGKKDLKQKVALPFFLHCRYLKATAWVLGQGLMSVDRCFGA